MFFTTGSEANEDPEDVASSREMSAESAKEPEKKVFAPNEYSGDANGDYAEPEIFWGEYRSLVPTYEPKECRAKCTLRRDRSRKKKIAGRSDICA